MNEIEKCIFELLQKSSSSYLSIKTLKIKCGDGVISALFNLEKKGIVISKRKKYALVEKLGYIKGIFDGKKEVYDDWDIPNPQGLYARSKYAGEVFVKENAKKCKLGCIGRIRNKRLYKC